MKPCSAPAVPPGLNSVQELLEKTKTNKKGYFSVEERESLTQMLGYLVLFLANSTTEAENTGQVMSQQVYSSDEEDNTPFISPRRSITPKVNESTALNLSNRFSILADTTVDTTAEPIPNASTVEPIPNASILSSTLSTTSNQINGKNKIKKKYIKKRVQIIGSSHARGLAWPTKRAFQTNESLKYSLDVDVHADSYPSACSNHLLSAAGEGLFYDAPLNNKAVTVEPDVTVFICGGNDLDQGRNIQDVIFSVKNLVEKHQKSSNIAVCSIMRPRHKETFRDKYIQNANFILREAVENIGAIFVETDFKFNHYRFDGKHLNQFGKRVFGRQIVNALEPYLKVD